MAAPKFNEKSSVVLSPELKLTLDLIQDATLVHPDEEILSYSQLSIASPHMPPHQYLVDSEDEMDESDDDDYIINDLVIDDDDSDDDDIDFNDKSKFDRPPSRLGRPMPYKSRNPKRNGLSVDRIKMENAFLKNQNNKLAQELDQCRLTIQALKNIVGQKDVALQSSRAEHQQAIIQMSVLEALILSKHSKDGSIIVRSGGGGVGYNNLPSVDSLLQEKESMKSKDILQKPVSQESDPPAAAPLCPQQKVQLSLSQSPILQSVTDSSDRSDDILSPPPLPPKNRHNRRWSMEFGSNNQLGNEFEEYDMTILSNNSNMTDMTNVTSNITQATSSDDNTLISSGTPSSSTLTPINNHDLHRNLPRLLKRRTGDIIQTLASCRPMSTKNGYSPPSTPSSERDDESIEEINEKTEKPMRRKKSTQQNMSRFRKIFLR